MTAQPNLTNRSRRHGPNPGDEMLTLQEACRFLRVPEGTLRYWRHLGSGPRSFKIGRHVRYWRADLILWLTEQTNRAQPSPPLDGKRRRPEGR
jgi:predicted DNA-binding transcriptional regulator AlpA